MYEVLKKAEKDINASLPTAHVDIGENNTNESASTSGNETVQFNYSISITIHVVDKRKKLTDALEFSP